MIKRRILIPVIIIAAIAIFFGGWELMYPAQVEPKGIRYVFWKAGMWNMDLDTAMATMVGDADRNKLVVGKTVAELQTRFGVLLDPSQTTEYYRRCNQTSDWEDKKVLFLRNSPWMVVFEGDRATDLVLCKGY